MQFIAIVLSAASILAAPTASAETASVPVLFKSALAPHGCTRYVKGFDITGVTTEVDLTFAQGIKKAQDCFDRCASSPSTCVSWVWKFTTDPLHRTCTLYSNFNLPSAVTIAFDVAKSTANINNDKLMANNNNPQAGAVVPQCTQFNSTKVDNECMSGMSYLTASNVLLC